MNTKQKTTMPAELYQTLLPFFEKAASSTV
jgi:hypothetical protein